MSLTTGLVYASEMSLGNMPDVSYTENTSRYKTDLRGTNTNIAYTRLPSGLWVHNFYNTSVVTIANHNCLNPYTQTLMCWVKITAPIDAGLLEKGVWIAGNCNYSLSLLFFSFVYIRRNTVDVVDFLLSLVVPPTLNRWYFLSVTEDIPNAVALGYVNGVLVATDNTLAGTVNPLLNTENLLLGTSSNHYQAGTKIFDRVLNAAEILKIYNAEKWMFGL